MVRPLSLRELRELYAVYRPAFPTTGAFDEGFEWAREPIHSKVALVVPQYGGWDAYDFVVSHAVAHDEQPVREETWNFALGHATPHELLSWGPLRSLRVRRRRRVSRGDAPKKAESLSAR